MSMTRADAAGSVWRAEPKALAVGTSIGYAKFHQFGTRRMVARPPLRPSAEFARDVAKDLQAFVAAAWKLRRQQLAGA
jgi:phage gpG-like protein